MQKNSFMENLSEHDKLQYKRYKILSSVVTSKADIKQLIDIYASKMSNKSLICILDNDLYSHRNDYTIGVDEFMNMLDKLGSYSYRDDARNLVEKIFRRTCDTIQRNSVIRIISRKPPRSNIITMKEVNSRNACDTDLMEKHCPHCGKREKYQSSAPTYIICGYYDKGFDWVGCGRDWCFRCGKKLCKVWADNELFVKNNRFHNERCCKIAAHKNNESYNKLYCKCSKIYINHRI